MTLIVAGSYDEKQALRSLFPACNVITIWDSVIGQCHNAIFVTPNVDIGSPDFGAHIASRLAKGGIIFKMTPAARVPHA